MIHRKALRDGVLSCFRGYENGVATGMRMRYPSFSVESRITKLEVLQSACNR